MAMEEIFQVFYDQYFVVGIQGGCCFIEEDIIWIFVNCMGDEYLLLLFLIEFKAILFDFGIIVQWKRFDEGLNIGYFYGIQQFLFIDDFIF